eukprot:338616-Pyramimonas_sp.AAC.1
MCEDQQVGEFALINRPSDEAGRAYATAQSYPTVQTKDRRMLGRHSTREGGHLRIVTLRELPLRLRPGVLILVGQLDVGRGRGGSVHLEALAKNAAFPRPRTRQRCACARRGAC